MWTSSSVLALHSLILHINTVLVTIASTIQPKNKELRGVVSSSWGASSNVRK